MRATLCLLVLTMAAHCPIAFVSARDTTLKGITSLFVSDDGGEGTTSTNPSEAFVSVGLFGQSFAK